MSLQKFLRAKMLFMTDLHTLNNGRMRMQEASSAAARQIDNKSK